MSMELGWLEPERVRPLSRVEYDRMVEAGIFAEDERIELIRGWLVRMSPIGTDHCETVDLLNELLVRRVGDRARVRCSGAFAASDVSEPQPDFSILPRRSYRLAHPQRALLLVEVAESSLRFDRTVKLTLYAEAGVPEYWVVNLPDRVVEIHRSPIKGRYRTRRVVGAGKTLRIKALPGVTIPVDAIFA